MGWSPRWGANETDLAQLLYHRLPSSPSPSPSPSLSLSPRPSPTAPTIPPGKIPRSRTGREFFNADEEIITCRLVDRTLRPLFPSGYQYDTQVVGNLVSLRPDCLHDVLAVNAASAALTISNIPFRGPVAAVRLGRIDGEYVVNPTGAEMERSSLNLVYAGESLVDWSCFFFFSSSLTNP